VASDERYDLLLASIGGRDPETEHGPLGPLRAALELRPRQVILIAHTDVIGNAEKTQGRIVAQVPDAEVQVLRLDLDDPVHIDRLVTCIDRLLTQDEMRARLQAARRLAVCASSGTPQITLALTLVTLFRLPGAEHLQALDPQKAGTSPLRPFDPDVLRHHTELEQALTALEGCELGEARRLLHRRLESPSLTAKRDLPQVRAAHAVCQMLLEAEAFDPRAAAQVAQVGRRGLPAEAAEGVAALHDWYRRLTRRRQDNPAWAVELVALALRQRTAGRQAQALITAAIAFEVALVVRFKTAHGLDPYRLSAAELTRFSDGVRKRARPVEKTTVFSLQGAEQLTQALKEIDPAFVRLLDGQEGARKQLIERRNKLVHEGKPPEEATLDSGLQFLRALCRAFDWPDPEEVPSAPPAIKQIVRALRGALTAPQTTE
jgi:hypothetical protein